MELEPLTTDELAPVSRGRRARALIIVLLVAFGWPLLNSTLIFIFVGRSVKPTGTSNATAAPGYWNILAIVYMLGCLAFLVWMLRRQRRTLRDIGLSFSWKDIPRSLLLFLVSYAALYIASLIALYGYFFATGRLLDLRSKNLELLNLNISLVSILIILINPFFEELLARAYLMTELDFLSGRPLIAVLVSAGFQASYHLYQGVIPMFLIFALFLVYSIYFVRRKRILPIILAHLYMDLIGLFLYFRN
ncbi:MAG: CPBP family glutamic-type intramembrane protease [Pyrinomonadaceae bacterium]